MKKSVTYQFLLLVLINSIALANTETLQMKTPSEGTLALGPGATGGGEDRGQKLIELAKTLPSFIEARGAHLYPEINLKEMRAFLKISEENNSAGSSEAPFKVELRENLQFEGSPKVCLFDQGQGIVYLDPIKWDQIKNAKPAIENVLRAIVFHEVLGLMKLETNNDYHISSRFLGNEYLMLANLQASNNQVTSTYQGSTKVIYWREGTNDTITFFYCEDRHDMDSCSIIGTRTYTKSEIRSRIEELHQMLKAEKDQLYIEGLKSIQKVKRLNQLKYIAVISTAIFGAALGVMATKYWSAATFGGFASLIISLPIVALYENESTQTKDRFKEKEDLFNEKSNSGDFMIASFLKNPVAQFNLRDIAQKLNIFLLGIDAQSATTKSPLMSHN